MAISNEERRQVAARLREKHKERSKPDVWYPQMIGSYEIAAIADLRDCLPYGDDIFHILADLIEPEPERTCQIDDSGYCVCGYPLGDWVTWRMDDRKAFLYERANYCPNCGARVKEDA